MTLIDQLKIRLRAERRVTLEVKAIPKSSKTELAGTMDDHTLKIKVAAPPDKGKANAELCRFVAELFDVRQQNVHILRGEKSPHKVVSVSL